MKTKRFIIYLLGALGFASCSSEDPFDKESGQAEGQVSTAAIQLAVNFDETIKVRSQGLNEDLLPDFDIYFLNSAGQTVKSYKYGEMPEVVTLNQGSYRIVASYGKNLGAEWNNPYFKGESKQFEIKPNKITTEIDPVECSLQNVMVSVVFDKELLEHITGEPQVEVFVNNNGSLIFNKVHSDNKTPGYFMHDDVNTLVAEFTGVVDGVNLREIKTLNEVKPGIHYRLTFYRHVYTGDESGDVETDVMVDAKVTVNDVSGKVTIEEDEPLTDVTWPTEDGDEDKKPGGDTDPENPDDPTTPDNPSSEGPSIDLVSPSTVEFGKVNDVNEDSIVKMKITSKTGLTKFNVDIVSETLHLSDLGADSDSFDMINPGSMLSTLQALGLLKEGQESLEGETIVDFDITGFMGMLTAVQGEHHFVLTVGDAEGETVKTLILNVP